MASQKHIIVPKHLKNAIRLMVVDDEQAICNLIKSSLEELDDKYIISIANSATQALKKLLQDPVDILITDLKMPKMGGMQLLKSVNRQYQDTSIVIITAHGNLDTAIEALRLGAANYMEKPVSMKLLHHTIQEIINKQNIFKELQDSEERFRTVFHSTPDAIFIAGLRDKLVITVNQSFTELIGFEVNEIKGKTFDSLEIWFNQDAAAAFYDLLNKKLLVSNFRTKFKSRDDRIFSALVSARVVSLDLQPHVIVVIRDVSELELAVAARNESDGKYLRIFQNIQDAYFEIKLDGTLLEISPSVENILYYKREELLGRPEFKIWGNQAELYNIVKTFRKTKKLKDCEIQLWRRDHVLLTCSINAIIADGNSDSDAKIIGSMRDITEQKKIKQQLVNNQKLETISRLAGGIAHDFNNMLTGILGFADLARGNVDKEDPLYNYLTSIIGKSNEASVLVEHLMAFSSSRKLEMRVLNLNDVLQPLCNFLKKTLTNKINLKVNLQPNLDIIQADFHSIQQVVTNLCLNSESAMPDGGEIIITSKSVSIAPEDPLTQQGIKPGPYVLLTVSDTGRGIEKEDIPRIFDPYFTTRKIGQGEGGLGLSAVYGLIKQHNGYLTCESTPGELTTFKLFFPGFLTTDVPVTAPPTEPIDTRNKNVLIVDDDKSVITVVRKLLEREHFHVVIASDGHEALEILKGSDEFNIIISDVIMPEMSGYTLVEKIKEINYNCKIILISGYDPDPWKIEAHGDVEFLQKPFNSSELMDTISKLYQRA